MTDRTEQDRATQALAEKDSDAKVVILPAKFSAQDGCTVPDAEESMRFMIKTNQPLI